jgi:RimJ/RimL family protein N-acetyltransferase
MSELRTARLLLSPPTEADIDAIAAYCADPEVQRWTTVPSPYTRKDAASFLEHVVAPGWRDGTEESWGIRLAATGELLGMISARRALEDVGYWMGAPHRGRGYLLEALTAVLDHRFAAGQELVNWECVLGNVPSARTARRAGFTFTGEAPSRIRARDGSIPAAWHGVLHRDDDRSPKPGWPEAVA